MECGVCNIQHKHEYPVTLAVNALQSRSEQRQELVWDKHDMVYSSSITSPAKVQGF